MSNVTGMIRVLLGIYVAKLDFDPTESSLSSQALSDYTAVECDDTVGW